MTILNSLSKTAVPSSLGVVKCGWIHRIRRHKNVHFVHLKASTISAPEQLVLRPEMTKELTIGSYLQVRGLLKDGEMQVEAVEKIGPCAPMKYPLTGIDKNAMKEDLLRNSFPHLRIRTIEFAKTMKARADLLKNVRSYLESQGFIELQLPSLTYTDCEGGGETFRVVDPDNATATATATKTTFLSVSGQMYLEMAIVGLGKVYSIGPCFRAEKTHTRRHMNEFTMLECEVPFVDCIQSLMDQVEDFYKATTTTPTTTTTTTQSIERITYTEAINRLKPSFPEVSWTTGITGVHERFLVKQKNQPIFIYNYPTVLKPFYMKKNPLSPETCASFDLIAPGIGELVGGGLRVSDTEEVLKAMAEKKIPAHLYSWYTDLRRYGSSPHGGWGIGIDRLVQLLEGKDNIRDCVLVPRCRLAAAAAIL